MTARYGLGGVRVLGATALGGGNVGFLLGREIAIADGGSCIALRRRGRRDVRRARGRGRLRRCGRSERSPALRSRAEVGCPSTRSGVTHAAVGAGGRLYAATPRAVYAADSQGRLALVYDATEDSIHGLVASGSVVWFADGEELGVVDGERVAETNGAKIGREAKLSSSSSGDVWVLSGGGLNRFTRSESAPSDSAAWASAIAPIFVRSCSACHLPDGAAGTDLLTAAAWEGERAEILERVVEKRSMPPEGHPLSEDDREAIRRWIRSESAGVASGGKAAPGSP